MGANGRPRTYELAGGAMVTPRVNAIIKRFAASEDRPIAYIIRKLLEESPRVKAAMKNSKKSKV
jgi:hypothetical protein